MSKHLIKVFINIFAFLAISVSVKVMAAQMVTDSFETGDLSHSENGFSWGQSESISVSTTFPRTGKYSLKFTFPASSPGKDSFSEQRFDLGSEYSEITVQYYIYYPNGSEGIGPKYAQRLGESPDNNKFIRLWGNSPRTDPSTSSIQVGASMWPRVGYSHIGAEYKSTYNGSPVLDMDRHGIPLASLVDSSTVGTWIKVKYHAKAATSANNDGVLQIWINDELRTDIQNLAIYPGDGYLNGFTGGYLLGWSNTGFDSTTNIYIDDIVIFTGPENPRSDPPFVTNVK